MIYIQGAEEFLNLFSENPAQFMERREYLHNIPYLAAIENGIVNLGGEGEPERVGAARVTADFFKVLQTTMFIGSTFQGMTSFSDDVVISYALWQHKFKLDRQIIGRTIRVNGTDYTIAGVLPRHIVFPGVVGNVDVYLPFVPGKDIFNSEAIYYEVLGRVRPGIDITIARQEMVSVMRQSGDQFLESSKKLQFLSFRYQISEASRSYLTFIQLSVSFVLLIACVNVTALLLARGIARQRELAIMATLGADRRRLILLGLWEGIILAGTGGLLGIILVSVSIDKLSEWLPLQIHTLTPLSVDWVVVTFMLLISVGTGVFSSVMPALRFSRPDLNELMKDAGIGTTSLTTSRGLKYILFVETVITTVLLIGAGVMIFSYSRLINVNPGFTPVNVLTVDLFPNANQYTNKNELSQFYQSILDKIKAIPGVNYASFSNHLPLTRHHTSSVFGVFRRDAPDSPIPGIYNQTSAEYFLAMGISLRRGRFFTRQDESYKHVIINESLSHRLFPNTDPVGKVISIGAVRNEFDIIGVVGDTRQFGLELPPRPAFYILTSTNPSSFMSLVIRSKSAPKQLESQVREAIWSVDPELPLRHMKTMTQVISESVEVWKFITLMMLAFAIIALIMTIIGFYSVFSYSVECKFREYGIRMALGATPFCIFLSAMRDGTVIVITGSLVGAFIAPIGIKLLSSYLFGVNPFDLGIYALIVLIMIGSAITTFIVPSSRASLFDPSTALWRQ